MFCSSSFSFNNSYKNHLITFNIFKMKFSFVKNFKYSLNEIETF